VWCLFSVCLGDCVGKLNDWIIEYVGYAHTHTQTCAVVTIRRTGVLQILRKSELSIHVALDTNKQSSLQIEYTCGTGY
jgi:hypothetical protein